MGKILIVDDSRLSRHIVRGILESGGYTVTEATDGLSALEQYVLDRPDVVVLDLNMQGMYGLDVLQQLREIDPQVCVIVGSADIQRPTRILAQESGARAFVAKPFAAPVLLETVAQVLAGDPL